MLLKNKETTFLFELKAGDCLELFNIQRVWTSCLHILMFQMIAEP